MFRACLAFFVAIVCLPVFTAEVRADEAVDIKLSNTQVDFLVGKELITTCNVAPDLAKPFLWPVNGPGGVPLTRAWPMKKGEPNESTDHVHQKSAWFCHGDVIPEGITLKDKIKGVEGVDFWSENQGHGRIKCVKVHDVKTEKNHGQVTLDNEWQTSDETLILLESRTIHLYNFGDTNLFVFEIELRADVCAITFGDTKEGSFGIRINDSIAEKSGKGRLENADGKVGMKDCWGQRSDWCDYSGPVEDHFLGIAIFDDPKNQYRACWHSRDYGLMAANPFGRAKSGFPAMKDNTELAAIKKGDTLKFRYGLLLHPGNAKDGKVAEFYEKFLKLK